MQKIAIIVPCYNEANRLSKDAFTNFMHIHPDTNIFFVNDGSTDKTQFVLAEIENSRPGQVKIITLNKNKGKANAVRTGLLAAKNKNLYDHIGYLDADLSSSLEEFYRLYELVKDNNKHFITGSRIKMLNTKIERSSFRHITGRIIATILDSKFKLGIYDTQCGAKCFKQETIDCICEQPFKTKWLFDVEIFLRLRTGLPQAAGIEAPLNCWEDAGKSKIRIFNFPLVIKEIFSLFLNYRKP